jgi:heptaprenyl diphosphate synthase
MHMTNENQPAATNVARIAVLVALACVLQIAESFIPHPIPGLRLGLANMITLMAMILHGFGFAMEIALLRTILSACIMGTFMSPTFILSLSGAIVSTAAMGFFHWLSGTHRCFRLSVIGISIIGALTHNMVQLALAYHLLIKHEGIFIFFPWLSIGAIATGWVVGVVTAGVCRQLLDATTESANENPYLFESPAFGRHYQRGTSFLHRAPPSLKLLAMFLLAIFSFVTTDIRSFWVIFLLMVFVAAISRVSLTAIFWQMKRYMMLPLTALLLPICFHTGTDVFLDLGNIKITSEGLHTGMLFAFRIQLLLFASCLLMKTTSLEEIARGVSQSLFPLEIFGISRYRAASILTLAWEAIPVTWGATRGVIAAVDFKKVNTLRNLIPILSRLIAALYLHADQIAGQKAAIAPLDNPGLNWNNLFNKQKVGFKHYRKPHCGEGGKR